jgi:hypothetical protein
MMTVNVQREIVKNISGFSESDMRTFWKYLADEAPDANDMVDMIKVSDYEAYCELDTLVRDRYINAYLKMHLS